MTSTRLTRRHKTLPALYGLVPAILILLSAPALGDFSIDNGLVSLTFDETNYGLVGIAKPGLDLELHPGDPLWRVHVYDTALGTLTTADLHEFNSHDLAVRSHSLSAGEDTLTLRWEDMDLAGQGQLDFSLRVVLPAGATRAQLLSELDLDTERHALWSVTAPCFTLYATGDSYELDTAVVPLFGNALVADPADNLDLTFELADELEPHRTAHETTHPGEIALQQYHLYDAIHRQGLLYGTEDRDGWMKRISSAGADGGQGVAVQFRHFPPHDGAAAVSWSQPYPAYLEPFDGDWVDGARAYRDRVSQMPWMSPGALFQRTNVRDSALQTNLSAFYPLAAVQTDPDSCRQIVEEFVDFMGPDAGLTTHSRNWGWRPYAFDPAWSWPPETLDFWAFTASLGLGSHPYSSTRDLPFGYETHPGMVQVAHTYNGDEYRSNMFSSYVLCPGSGWSDTYPDLVDVVLANDGLTDLYCDNFPKPSLCHNPLHIAHLPGGGTYWLDGYRYMLDRIRTAWPEAFLINESRCEYLIPYLDFFPAHAWDQKGPGWFTLDVGEPLPLVPAVYHDRIRNIWSVLSVYGDNEPQTYRFMQAWAWINGTCLSHIIDTEPASTWDLEKTASIGYLRDLAVLAGRMPEYAVHGRWERPPGLSGFGDVIVQFEPNGGVHEQYGSLGVLGGCLVSPEDRLAVLLTNFTGETRSGMVTVDLDEVGVGVGPWTVWKMTPVSPYWVPIDECPGSNYAAAWELGPRESVVLRFLRYPTDVAEGVPAMPEPLPLSTASAAISIATFTTMCS